MNRKSLFVLMAIGLCFTATVAVADGHEGGDRPPMLVLMPPPDVEKPEGVEMTGDPEEDFRTIFRTFFRLMDQDGSGELSPDELRGWVHPGPGPGMGEHDGMMGDRGDMGGGMMGDRGGMGDGMGGGMGGDLAEKVRRLEERLRQVNEERRMRHEEQIRRAREHLAQLEENARRMQEAMQNHEGGHEGGDMDGEH